MPYLQLQLFWETGFPFFLHFSAYPFIILFNESCRSFISANTAISLTKRKFSICLSYVNVFESWNPVSRYCRGGCGRYNLIGLLKLQLLHLLLLSQITKNVRSSNSQLFLLENYTFSISYICALCMNHLAYWVMFDYESLQNWTNNCCLLVSLLRAHALYFISHISYL